MLKVKIFDCDTESELEEKVNDFLEQIEEKNLITLKYQVATMMDGRDQIYCFSCFLCYRQEKMSYREFD
jgi:hypothetical protein